MRCNPSFCGLMQGSERQKGFERLSDWSAVQSTFAGCSEVQFSKDARTTESSTDLYPRCTPCFLRPSNPQYFTEARFKPARRTLLLLIFVGCVVIFWPLIP
mmetsp:Transcript_56407/g.115417  ORF Transcript_56407/g.115417 Transcript_56407/m.115417 type:complete len:101 (-) Transcript_56407:324-626(-)